MRNVFAFLALFAFPATLTAGTGATLAQELPAAPSPADQTPANLPEGEATVAQKRSAELDRLFLELRKTHDETKAKRIADQIYGIWNQSGSATVDLMMGWANTAIREKKYPVALDFLNEIVVLKPDYAEGWNRRATLYFLMNDYGRAMYDINKTLQLEPRQFAALAGMGSILKETGRKELALRAYERALTVYPMMREAQKEVGEIADELAGSRT
ncbi:hypothetical protein DUT91_10260 [Phyllobacterium salinisoli]|uniref:Uncharacterized protein n=1 Tax=Phyllobacterium salinisoli TaxID=1899321 RepID=A0A368K5X4_9HYPH|nr:hypothetical protein [Phyllobacterium salinisoli]RCS24035.1 hypothetical protein DUT91_10260 [Phyllobacterium salinisoli]